MFKNKKKLGKLSTLLSYVLRHQANEMNIPISEDGYVRVDDLLANESFLGYTVDDLRQVVADNDKQRFKILETDGVLYIRAQQGHSISTINGESLDLELIKDPLDLPICLHGTSSAALELILGSGGLNRMARLHIHMAVGLPQGDGVISGMRKSCDVVIYIDVESAMRDGIKFYRSSNNVILSEGINGVISSKYFKEISRRQLKSPR